MADYDWFKPTPAQIREEREREERLREEGYAEIFGQGDKLKCLTCAAHIYKNDKELHSNWHAS